MASESTIRALTYYEKIGDCLPPQQVQKLVTPEKIKNILKDWKETSVLFDIVSNKRKNEISLPNSPGKSLLLNRPTYCLEQFYQAGTPQNTRFPPTHEIYIDPEDPSNDSKWIVMTTQKVFEREIAFGKIFYDEPIDSNVDPSFPVTFETTFFLQSARAKENAPIVQTALMLSEEKEDPDEEKESSITIEPKKEELFWV